MSEIDDPPGAAVLAAAGLTKHFSAGRAGAVHALDDLDLALRAGQVVALVGESGSGKSTAARLLARLHMPTRGQVLLHGEPVTARRGRAFRAYCRRVQMIFQDPFASLNPVHTVRYTLTRALRIHHPALRGPELEAALRALLDRVQLRADRYVDKFPHELSGGQRQRVAIARALAADPEVLLADEPISMLDVSIRLEILNLLDRLRRDDGLALLYITHDIASARYLCDEIAVMYAGRIVEHGPAAEVLGSPVHPYTRALAAADPTRVRQGERLVSIGGGPPVLHAEAPGCAFAPRCAFADDACSVSRPVPALLRGRVHLCLRAEALEAVEVRS